MNDFAEGRDIDVTLLRAWAQSKRDAMLADLRRYVELESPSDDVVALEATLSWLDAWVQDSLGVPSSRRRIGKDGEAGTLVFEWPGEGERILILAHYDTVWPTGTLVDMPFVVDGDVVRGPGVFDMKAGLVQAVWAVKSLIEHGVTRPPIRLLLNGDEEVESVNSRAVIEDSCADVAAVLVFEGSADGALKTARKGAGLFQLEVTGEAAHAGLDPTAGASAIIALAHLALELDGLTNLAAGTSVNVGVISGGTRPNVRAARASASIDVRVADPKEAERIEAALRVLNPHNPRVGVAVLGGWNRPVMPRSQGTAALYGLARDLAWEIGVPLREASVGGASDGNFAAACGRPVLDGLGAVGGGAHAAHEHATVSGMVERTAIAAAVMASLSMTGRHEDA
jgi:glutamate carboxypeptidase